jgi:lon-related putative ATP-dependent protease
LSGPPGHSTDRFRVPLEELRRRQDPADFGFECTQDLSPLTELVGQDRALRSLKFGLGIDKPGYNVFVTGLAGTGKATAILDYLRRTISGRGGDGQSYDWCYAYNFNDPDRPNVMRLRAGQGRRLRDQLEDLLWTVRTNISRAFMSDEYDSERRALMETGQAEAQKLIEEAQKEAAEAGFSLNFSPTGISLLPMRNGQIMTPEQYGALSQEERAASEERQRGLSGRISETAQKVRAIERQVGVRLRELDQQVVRTVMTGPFESIIEEYKEDGEVPEFLRELQEFMAANIELLREQEGQTQSLPPHLPGAGQPDPFLAFRINLFVDNSLSEGPPIVLEPNPTWSNLFGRIERKAFLGTYISDHTLLKPGAVQRANGGYLVLNLTDVMTKPGAWDGLKRLIRTREARLEDPMEQFGFFAPQALRPEPIPIDLKIIVTGDPMAYFLLTAYDEEFWEMFKVKADFDFQITRDTENTLAYAGFVCAVCERENLRHFDRSAVARLVEHGSRTVDDQTKLSARFGRLRDVVVEADYWAGQANAELVSGEHVERAISERIYRLNLVEERLRELIARGTLMVDTDGAVVGQVNGLAVLDYGDISFGRPSRITARTFLGQRGVISIDRESQLSGKIHDKGVLTLSSFLGWKYAQDKPLSLSASISFEQGYDAIEGDSASLAELCAVLSSLSDLPLTQELAMTGSVNQKGEVQPIGGVNQKIEGFHDLCRLVGFSGGQGVIIPARNRRNLMLREDVLASVERGDFRILSVNTVDEALEALTGTPAGERMEDGTYGEATVHHLVDKRLREMGEAMRQFGRRSRDGATPEKAEEEPAPAAPPPADDAGDNEDESAPSED